MPSVEEQSWVAMWWSGVSILHLINTDQAMSHAVRKSLQTCPKSELYRIAKR
jgi:hypothetical protein